MAQSISTRVDSGTLQIGNGGAAGSLAGNVETLGALGVNRSDAVTFGGTISGHGSFIQMGSGTTTLTAANTYTGGTTLAAGALRLSSADAIGTSGTIRFSGGALQYSSANTTDYSSRFSHEAGQQYKIDTNGQNVTLAAAIASAGGSLAKFGAGQLTLTGSNSYSGGTLVSGGTLSISNDANLGAESGTLTLNGGALRISDNVDMSRQVLLQGGGTLDLSNETYLNIFNTVSGTGGLDKTGTGYLTLVGAQTYTGATNVQGGFFKVESGSLAASSVNLSAATFYLANSTGVLGAAITGSGTFNRGGAGTSILTGGIAAGVSTVIESGTLQIGNGGTTGSVAGNLLNNGTLSVNRSNAVVLAGTISGNGSFFQLGGGKTTLSGSNTYLGDTIIRAGTLAVDGSIAGDVLVETGGTLGGRGVIAGAVTVESGGVFSPGNSPDQITLLDHLTLEDGSVLLMEIAGTSEGLYDQLDVQGFFTAGGTLNLMLIDSFVPLEGASFQIFNGPSPGFDAGSFAYATNLGGGLYWDTSALASSGIVSVVPEPGTVALVALGLGICAARRLRWRR